LALVTDAFGGEGGIAQYNRDFLGSLAAGGIFSSVIVLPRHAPTGLNAQLGITQLAPRKHEIGYALAALWLGGSRRADVIFCGHLYMAALAALVARLTGAKLIVQMHGIEAWRRPSRAQRMAVESADLVLCVSRHTRAAVLGWARIAPERVVVLPNTVADEFTPGDGSALRTQLGLDGKRVLLTVGRMVSRERYKGHDRVIAAIPQLIANGHDVVYMIAGQGNDRGHLEALAVAAGIAERVMFLGPLDPARLVEAYRMADLFVMPSTGEGFGIAFLEAMACGTPAVGLDVAGAIDALADGDLGTLTNERNVPTVISRLLAGSKPDRRTLAAAVHSRFGRETFAANLRAALTPLLAVES